MPLRTVLAGVCIEMRGLPFSIALDNLAMIYWQRLSPALRAGDSGPRRGSDLRCDVPLLPNNYTLLACDGSALPNNLHLSLPLFQAPPFPLTFSPTPTPSFLLPIILIPSITVVIIIFFFLLDISFISITPTFPYPTAFITPSTVPLPLLLVASLIPSSPTPPLYPLLSDTISRRHSH